MGRLRIKGAWVGVLEVELDKWTLPMLKHELAKRSNSASNSINLFSEGRILKESDGNPNLAEIGVKNNAKVWFSRIEAEQGQFLGEQLQAEEVRSERFDLLKKAVIRLADRHTDGPGPDDNYTYELADKSTGEKVNLDSKIDESAAMMGLLMHIRAKQLMKEKSYKDAIEVLKMAEEALSLCDPAKMKGVNNVYFVQIDMVWCYFMLRDISFLSEAGGRLARACKRMNYNGGGMDDFRAKLLKGSWLAEEIALFGRMELLQGVIAYHSGEIDKCREFLTSAKEMFSKLIVSDESLTRLTSLGYEENEAKRALKLNNQNVERAADFLLERQKEAQKHADNIQRKKEIKFECEPAAEGLLNTEIQLDDETRKRKRDEEKEALISDLVSMGFERSRVVSTVAACKTQEEALKILLLPDEEKSVENPSSSGESEDSEQLDDETRKWKRAEEKEAFISDLVIIGFERSRVVSTVAACKSEEEALKILCLPDEEKPVESSSSSAKERDDEEEKPVESSSSSGEERDDEEEKSAESCSSSVVSTVKACKSKEEALKILCLPDGEKSVESSSSSGEVQEGDTKPDFDIDAIIETEVIKEYLALLSSSSSS